MSHYFHIFSYYFHIFITFLGSGPRSGPQKSYFCHIPGHIIFILFSYFSENLVFQPLHIDNLYKARLREHAGCVATFLRNLDSKVKPDHPNHWREICFLPQPGLPEGVLTVAKGMP